MMSNLHRNSEKGATALFIVIFSILLMSTITISFLSLMVREQQRSTNDELSQSAYDSALAGVEDAKRAIVASRGSGLVAQNAKDAIAASQQPGGCQAIGINVNQISSANPITEIPVQSTFGGGGSELNQAYTCLKVDNLTDDYQTTLEENQSTMVPMRMADDINQVRIYWQPANDVPGVTYGSSLTTPLLTKEAWNNSSDPAPAMLRLQTITPDSSFSLTDFDDAKSSSSIFLFPSDIGANITNSIDMPERAGTLSSANSPEPVDCIDGTDLANAILIDSFLCSVTINLKQPIVAGSDISYLMISPIYRATKIKIEGLMDGRLVQFDGAQPTVDSTGRANDLFRRVEARLTLGGEGESGSGLGGVIPQYALDVDGSICKSFYVSVGLSGEFGQKCQPEPATP